MARDKELESERAKTRELERLLRLAEAEFLARPGNENVVRPCCSCGQTTHSSADCRRYLYLEREASPPPQGKRWVEVASPDSREKPRLVTAAVSGISKRRPHKVGGGLVGPRVTTRPFKLSRDAAKELAVLRKIIAPDQLNRSAKPAPLAECSREGVTAGPAILPALRPIVCGSSATQPKAAESAVQATGPPDTLAAATRPGTVLAGSFGVGTGRADEPTRSTGSEPSDIDAEREQRIRSEEAASSANDSRQKATPGLPALPASIPIVSDHPATQLWAAEPVRDFPGKSDEPGNIDTPPMSATAAGGSVRTQAADALTGDPDLNGTGPLYAQACTLLRQCLPVRICLDKLSMSRDNCSHGAPNELSGAPKSRHSPSTSEVEEPLLADAGNLGSEVKTKVDKRAAEGYLAYAEGNNAKRGQVDVSVSWPPLLVMLVALALGAPRTGCRGGSPDAKYRDWGNNQSVDSHLEAAPD